MSSILQEDYERQHEDTTLAQLLNRTLIQSEEYLSNPPHHAPPTASTSTDHHPSTSTSSSSNATTTLTTLLSNLSLCSSLISHLALLSSNETLSELSTPTLPCLLVPYYTGMLDLQSRTKDYKTRIQVLNRSKVQLEAFKEKCDQYEVIPEDKRRELSLGRGGSLPSDPMSRRDAKIKQYKEEKALKEKIETIQQRQKARAARKPTEAEDDDDEEDEEILRSLYITQLSLCYMRAYNELNSISQEIELLSNLPNMSELPSSSSSQLDARQRKRAEDEEAQWRLDSRASLTSPATSASQLVDSSGRILRPFTILPSASSSSSSNLDTRLRLQNSVFGTGNQNLPSMSIDEYLDSEYERGNVLKGGGASNTAQVQQEREDKKAYEEEEDNMEGERRRDQKRIKELEDDEYRDSHKRGEGNRMNMG